jgi:Protein of unknown function (DUF3341)
MTALASAPHACWGWMAEFDSADELLAVAREAHAAGYAAEAYAPFHIEGLAEATGVARSPIAAITFIGALVGGVGGYAMEWVSAVIDRPLDIGGRPLHSWPMFVPVAFALTILGGALAAVLAFFWTAGLPKLRHPIFDAPDFELASRNRFFLVLRSDDPAIDHDGAARWLDERRPLRRVEVPA